MGWVYSHQIESAAKFMIEELRKLRSVHYSRYYDGEETTHTSLCQGIAAHGYEPEDEAEILVDIAVGELTRLGIVHTEMLDTTLADGEADYRISFSSKAEEILAGPSLVFRHLDL